MTIAKYILSKFYVDADINVGYVIKDNHIRIADKNTHNILCRILLDDYEHNPYYWFDIAFDSYVVKSYYDADTDSFVKKINKKCYCVVLHINLKTIMTTDTLQTSILCKKLSTYIIMAQMGDILMKNNYDTDQIQNFILDREINLMYFLEYHYFRINKSYVFDLENNLIMANDKIPSTSKINFNRLGGIIETNNTTRLIKTYFNDDSIFALVPDNMVDIWPGNSKLTFSMVKHKTVLEIKEFMSKKYCKLVILECSEEILPMIKMITNLINSKII